MGKVWVREFTGGLDARRLPENVAGGTLIRAKDGHINRGGEFEQRAAFVQFVTLPEGCKGLAATPTSLVTFGSATTLAVPTGVIYKQLSIPGGHALQRVLSATLYKGKLFVTARFADGSTHNFYDGARVTDYVAGATPGSFALTVQKKVYVTSGPNLLFSGVDAPTNFNTGSGAGFIDMSTQARGSETLTALAQYQQYLAVFAGRTVQIEYVDPDPAIPPPPPPPPVPSTPADPWPFASVPPSPPPPAPPTFGLPVPRP